MGNNNKPRLFGIIHSNGDFEQKETWGKNQFNSSFPTSLSVYMQRLGIENVYLKVNKKLEVVHSKISTNDLYGIECMSDNIFFSCESVYSPYQQFLIGDTPRIDLVCGVVGLSQDLKNDLTDTNGFSKLNLYAMRQFYLVFSNFHQLGGELNEEPSFVVNFCIKMPWRYLVLLLQKIKKSEELQFYISETIQNNWSRNVLQLQIDSKYILN